MSPAVLAEVALVQSELDLAIADALRQAATRSEHIRLTRIAVLVARLKVAGAGAGANVTDETRETGS